MACRCLPALVSYLLPIDLANRRGERLAHVGPPERCDEEPGGEIAETRGPEGMGPFDQRAAAIGGRELPGASGAVDEEAQDVGEAADFVGEVGGPVVVGDLFECGGAVGQDRFAADADMVPRPGLFLGCCDRRQRPEAGEDQA
jgi:hypothetical protein